ncbi:superoxide dismutase family protein [Paenibacillus aquistagni]|uniref:superoxide dismutase family protein n=1 Tax=Paenibacillus aquistagni TaxID=1852522 RepID=UPI001F0F4CC0|nr:superoxide dismutase family protein [Paenibacillus aquistagni]
MMKQRSLVYLSIAMMIVLLMGCEGKDLPVSAQMNEPAEKVQPIAQDIMDSKGSKMGTATFTQLAKGVQVDVKVAGLKPGLHGIHIHETGKCEQPDFKSAGGHFNPSMKEHGFDNPNGEHAGDIPNLVAGPDGTAEAQFVVTTVTLQKGVPNSLLKGGGTALIIHADPDDMHTNPAGNAGDRIGCAVIR